MNVKHRFFILATRGLEDIALKDLQNTLYKIKIKSKDYRRIIFFYDGRPSCLLALKAVDDIFAFATTFTVTHKKESLKIFEKQTRKTDFISIIKYLQQLRDIPKPLSFSITVSNIGKKNYTPTEIKKVISRVLSTTYGWKFVTESPEDINIRVFIEHDFVLMGVRIGQTPLHRRTYKTHSLPASLKSSVAYSLLIISNVKKEETVLDPMCGVGTIAIEAKRIGANVIAGDINKNAVQMAIENSKNANCPIPFHIWDARNLFLENHSIDKIVTNLPFDEQIPITEDKQVFFKSIFKEFMRVLKKKGTMVVLTVHTEIIINILSNLGLRLVSLKEISLFGLKPHILKIES